MRALLPALFALAACAPVVVVQPFAFDVALGCDGRFQAVNLTGATVRAIRATPHGAAWGRDLLGSGTLPPGSEATLALPPGPALLRARLADGREFALDGFDPCRAGALAVTEDGLRPRG